MASVQYLFSLSNDLIVEINEKNIIFGWLSKFRNLCAIIIQKTWRRYSYRQKYLRIRRMIIIIQSYYRGWVVRRNLFEYIQQHADDMIELRRQRAATTIKAAYKGYLVRKYMSKHRGTPAERVKKLRQMNDAAREMQDYIRKQFEENSKIGNNSKDDEIKKKVLFLLFKWHHLIRTRLRKGIYSRHFSDELSLIEELMKMFPFKEYMNKIHTCYQNAVKSQPPPYYFFQSRQLRRFEDLLRNRDRSRDVRPESKIFSPAIRFNFDTRISHPYERTLTGIGKYISKPIRNITHNDEIKEKNVSSRTFLLGNFNLDLNDRIIPYFIDYFEKHKCSIHYPPAFDD